MRERKAAPIDDIYIHNYTVYMSIFLFNIQNHFKIMSVSRKNSGNVYTIRKLLKYLHFNIYFQIYGFINITSAIQNTTIFQFLKKLIRKLIHVE